VKLTYSTQRCVGSYSDIDIRSKEMIDRSRTLLWMALVVALRHNSNFFAISAVSPRCNVTEPCWVGDGWCDDNVPGYNTEECGHDGGDCCKESCEMNTTHHLFPCGVNAYVCSDPVYQRATHAPSAAPTLRTIQPTSICSPLQQTPTQSPTKAPTVLATWRPTAQPTNCRVQTRYPSTVSTPTHATEGPNSFSPVATVSAAPTWRPSRQIPSQRTPSTAPHVQQTALPTARQSEDPSPVPSRRGAQPSSFPVLSIPPATNLPSANISGFPTSAPPTRPSTLTSSIVPTSTSTEKPIVASPPSATARFSFVVANITADAGPVSLTTVQGAVIAASLLTVLEVQLSGVNASATVETWPIASAEQRSASMWWRRLQRVGGYMARWDVSAVLVTVGAHSADVESTLRWALEDGTLEAVLRLCGANTPGGHALQHAVLCADEVDQRCLIPQRPEPTSQAEDQECLRTTRQWNALYASPFSLPWYLIWLGVQALLWAYIMAGSLCALRWKPDLAPALVALQCTAGAHLSYLGLVLWDYTEAGAKLACIEFAFADFNYAHSTLLTDISLALLLLRSLLYPSTVAVIAGNHTLHARVLEL
jgi:hypothetical protein